MLVTVFAAKGTGTWTIALTEPSGLSCIVAAGTGFELMPEALTLRGDPTPTHGSSCRTDPGGGGTTARAEGRSVVNNPG